MRLTTIKLAGFKSFVDPTTLHFPTNMTGVVGPNGCGKSNIIDAIRWVMGESAASRLRGDALTDVIFSGSSSRKPVGSAMVELLFDKATAAWVRDRIWHPSQHLTQLKDGRLRMGLTVADTRELLGWILSFGNGVRVVKPDSLRAAVEAETRSILRGYTQQDSSMRRA